MSPVLPISTIPNHLVIEILNKLHFKELVRMRHTCLMVDELVERNRRKFASRPHLGTDLGIKCSGSRIEFSYPAQLSAGVWHWVTFAKPENWNKQMERMLSGISFSKLDLSCSGDREASIKMNTIIKELKPKCLKLGRFSVSQRYILSILNDITITGSSDIKFSTCIRKKDMFPTKLANAKYHSLFNLSCYWNMLETNIFEKVKHFSSVAFHPSLTGFECLLWDLYNSKERIAIKSLNVELRIDIEKSHIPIFPYSSLPTIETLQKASNGENGIYLMMLHSCKAELKEKYMEFRKSLLSVMCKVTNIFLYLQTFDIKFLKKK